MKEKYLSLASKAQLDWIFDAEFAALRGKQGYDVNVLEHHEEMRKVKLVRHKDDEQLHLITPEMGNIFNSMLNDPKIACFGEEAIVEAFGYYDITVVTGRAYDVRIGRSKDAVQYVHSFVFIKGQHEPIRYQDDRYESEQMPYILRR